MKNIYVLFTALLFLPATLSGQILKIGEKDKDGRWQDKDGKMKADYIGNRIADINSVLTIDLQQDQILLHAGKSAGLSPALSKKLDAIHAALKLRNENLKALQALMEDFDPELFAKNGKAYDKYIEGLQAEANKVLRLTELDPRILPLALSETGDKKYTRYYIATEKVLRLITLEIEKFATEEGVYVQFGAWLKTKNNSTPLHIDGFDDITPQKPFEVERWQVILTPEQIAKLKDLEKFAKENRDTGLDIIKTLADGQLAALKTIVTPELDAYIVDIKTSISPIQGSTTAEVKALVAKVKSLTNKIEQFTSAATIRLNYYKGINADSGFDLSGFAGQISADRSFFITSLEEIKSSALEVQTQINNLSSNVKASASELKVLAENVKEDMITRLNRLQESAKFTLADITAGQQLDETASQFGEDVYKLSLSQLKSNIEFDLVNAGVRDDGDRIEFKFSMSNKKDSKVKFEESKEIYLFKVLPHVISTVGVAFADPFSDNTSIQTQFQMAPYYNLLFKGFIDRNRRRKSITYNKIMDCSIGLHVSAPDFNKDDVPELGAGIVFSILHDYLQAGLAYNVFTADPYWFFGLRIPLPSFGTSNL